MENIDFADDKVLARDFLSNFADVHGDPNTSRSCKMSLTASSAPSRSSSMISSITRTWRRDSCSGTENTRWYINIFAEAVDELLSDPTEVFSLDEDHDILMTQRAEDGLDNADNSDPRQMMPPEINRFFEVYIKAFSKGTPLTLRQVKAFNIDQLVKISSIMTRCSDVKPLLQVAVYTYEDCGFEIYQVYLQGATITSWRKKPDGENLIYINEQSISKGQKMCGGITICFPKFDEEIPTESSSPLGMQLWSLLEEGSNFLLLGLTLENIWEVFLRVSLDEKGNLQLKNNIRNISGDTLDFKVAAYCYMRVKDIRKVKVSGLYGIEYLNFINSKMHTDQKRPLSFEKEVRRLYLIPPQQEILMDSLEDSRELFCSSSTGRTYLNHTEELNTPDFLVWGNGAFAANKMNGLKKKDRQRFLFIAFGHMKETSLESLGQQTLSLTLTSQEHISNSSLEGFF